MDDDKRFFAKNTIVDCGQVKYLKIIEREREKINRKGAIGVNA